MRKMIMTLLLLSCACTLCFTGCKKESAAPPPDPTINRSETKAGFGSVIGTCNVCGKKSENLLRINLGSLTATICSKECGEKFRAEPMRYGTQNAPTNTTK